MRLFYMDGVSIMSVSYKKLWKLLIDRDMKKKDLQRLSGVSLALIAKLGRNENVSTESLVKICTAFGYDVGDVMEIIPGQECQIPDFLNLKRIIADNCWV